MFRTALIALFAITSTSGLVAVDTQVALKIGDPTQGVALKIGDPTQGLKLGDTTRVALKIGDPTQGLKLGETV